MNQRGSLSVFILLGVVLVSLGGGAFYFFSLNNVNTPNTESPLANPSPAQNKIAVAQNQEQPWNVYDNFNLDFTFSYPVELYLNESLRRWDPEGVNGYILIQNWDRSFQQPGSQSDFQIMIEFSKSGYLSTGKTQTLEEYLKDSGPGTVINTQKSTPFLVGDIQGYKGEISFSGQNRQNLPVVWIHNKNQIVKIMLETPSSSNAAWFEEILKTFKQADRSGIYDQQIFETYSPDHSIKVSYSVLGDSQKLSIRNKNYQLITEDAISLNEDSLRRNMTRLGLTGSGQIGYKFKDWTSNSTFILQISPANGMEFEVEVDGSTGKINESSFKKIE